MPATGPPGGSGRVEFVGFWYRLGAVLWDLLVIAVLSALVVALTVGNEFGQPHAGPMIGLLVIEVASGYILACWILFGRSLGQWLCSQRIVACESGLRPSPWRCLLRFACWPTTALFGWVTMLRDPYRRALHDRIVGTCVIGDESMRPLTSADVDAALPPPQPPPWSVPGRSVAK